MIKIVSPKKGSNAALIMWLMIVIMLCTILLLLYGMKVRNDILEELNKLEVMIEAIEAENSVEQDAIVESADTGYYSGIAATIDTFAVDHPEPVLEPEPVEVPDFSYLRDDIDLPREHQILLHNACEEFDIPFELALAVCWRETQYVNQVSDDGKYFGYMMLAAKWVWPEMEKLGVTDLMDPEGNFRIGCCLLRQFIDSKGSVEAALCRYSNDYEGWYANDVLTYMNNELLG